MHGCRVSRHLQTYGHDVGLPDPFLVLLARLEGVAQIKSCFRAWPGFQSGYGEDQFDWTTARRLVTANVRAVFIERW